MDTQPAFGLKELFSQVIGDVARVLCGRNGDTQDQVVARSHALVRMILGFAPADVIEAMIAGHCVMFHELIVASVSDALLGEHETVRRATRANIVAMDKAFGNSLTRLERYRTQRPEAGGDRPGVEAGTETDIADRVRRHAAETPARRPAPTYPGVSFPSPEAIAACRENPEAMAALNSGDAEGFARAMGIAQPSNAFLAAAARPGSIFDRRVSGKTGFGAPAGNGRDRTRTHGGARNGAGD